MFSFNSAFKPMGFPGMPQMHFPTFSSAQPMTPQMPAQMTPPQTPALPTFQQPMHGNNGMPSFTEQQHMGGHQDNPFKLAMDAWHNQRPDMMMRSDPGAFQQWRQDRPMNSNFG